MSSVTQSEIAQQLGISQRAVGYALSDSPLCRSKLRPETRRKVIETANRLGYRAHRYAQVMRMGRSGVIGMLQFGGFLQAAELRVLHAARAVHSHHYHLLNHHVYWHLQGVQDALDAILDARAEGLLLMNPTEFVPASFLKQIRDSRIPVVSLSGVHFDGVPQVRADAAQGTYEMTRHLLGVGHRRLTLLAQWNSQFRDEAHSWSLLERIQGFKKAAGEFGAGAVEAEVVSEEQNKEYLNPHIAGKFAMQKILALPRVPEAMLCYDAWALGALSACAEAGVRVPRDIAITGFDNDAMGEISLPPLTTVAQQAEAMANRAVELLVKQIRGETLSASERLVKIPCQLVVRQSCGAALGRRAGTVKSGVQEGEASNETEDHNQ